jgi:hypothetical protein
VDVNEEHDARWQDIMEAREDFADEPAPLRSVDREGTKRQRRGSRKSAQFNEALSGLGSWSSLDQPRRRMSA